MSLTNESLQNCYDLLWDKIAEAQKEYGVSEISFHDEKGFIWEQEGYKYGVASQAKKIMDKIPWDEPGIVGSGRIKAAALDALRAAQNLVDWSDIILFSEIPKTKEKDVEKALYNLFYANVDVALAFKGLKTVIGNKFALVSYFFFVKDYQKYEVMRPDNFAWRLQKVGASGKCTNSCSWENYEEYLTVLSEVQEFLNERVSGDITLLDAHTFMWMLWMIKDDNVSRKNNYLAVPDGESYVTLTGKEGKKTAFYTTKYERDPKLRKAAIQLRGKRGYQCEACGFIFEEKYGTLGKDFIEVHHAKPLFSLDEEIEINPATDLICLCSNCHRMIHRKKNAIMTVEELKSILKK